MDQAIKNNFLINQFTNTTLKPELYNNFKLLIPEVNILLNSGKKILFLLYQIVGILLLKIIGMIFYLVFEWF